MKIQKQAIFLFLLLLLSIYQDLPTALVFGQIASSPIIFLTLPMLLYLGTFKKMFFNKYCIYFINFFAYLSVVSIIYVIYLILTKQTLVFLNENIILKTIKSSVYPVIGFIYYLFIYNYLQRGKNTLDNLFKAMLAILILIAIYLPFEIHYTTLSAEFLSPLHAMSYKYWRIRLLTSEESFVGTIFTIFIFVTIFLANYLNKSNRTKIVTYIISLFILILYAYYSQSKGFLLLILVSILPMTIQYIYANEKIKKNVIYLTPFFIFLFVFVFFILYNVLSEKQNTDGTFGTRFTSYFAGFRVVLTHPFGVGWGAFIYYYPEAILETIKDGIITGYDLSEIKTYLTTTKNLSTKTELFGGIATGGIGFLYFYYKFFIKRYLDLLKNKQTIFFYLKAPLLFSLLAGAIYISYLIKYEFWFLLALIDVIQKKEYEKE